ncbi:citrate synthase/methylcitrate synthase [Capsulimonas corticalis]|uniref:Citrate synthase n=1 Tax=Capsulimonas corticalis TaxID=2219043 RepID=A0A402D5L7_9BACT|nr:citrate synthase/methylcitrate synthase [Capsulimonas corticalis]BDI29797.1 citrate synthase/methylcitrate synthase [Capsulimonas corticalis]
MRETTQTVAEGLEGVVAARTRISDVDGEAGRLTIAGFALEEIAGRATAEEMIWLLWRDALPTAPERDAFARDLAERRALPSIALDLLRAAAARQSDPMDALRMAAATLSLDAPADDEDQARTVIARFPVIAAAYERLSQGHEPIAPRPDLGHAANYLYCLTGAPASPERVRALETYWNAVADHGLNASTFTARVIAATGSDLVSAVTGAVGALKGPLHGGAPGPALDMVFEIGSPERAEPILREKLERGERMMGFGHRIYKVRDPRADVLASAAERLFQSDGDRALYRIALEVEQTVLRLLEEYKPGRRLQTNVEFYTALLLHGLGMPTRLFTPTFAAGRAAGWLAHCFEQRRTGRIIRPQSEYVGERGRTYPSQE